MKKVFRLLSLAAVMMLGAGYVTATAAPAALVSRVLTLFQQGKNDGYAWVQTLDPNDPAYYSKIDAKDSQAQANAAANVAPGSAYWQGFSVGLQHGTL